MSPNSGEPLSHWQTRTAEGLPHKVVTPGWTFTFRDEAQNTDWNLCGSEAVDDGLHCRVFEDQSAFALKEPANVSYWGKLVWDAYFLN